MIDLHIQLKDIIRLDSLYPFSHLYIGGNQSLLYPLCHRIIDIEHTYNLLYTINHYRVCGRMIGSYPQIAPLPRKYVTSMGIRENNYNNYTKQVQAINKNRNYPYPSGIK